MKTTDEGRTKMKEGSDYRHGENGAWVYNQNCVRSGHVVNFAEVEAFSERTEADEEHSDWTWWPLDYAQRTLADEGNGVGPNHVFSLRAAAYVIRYND